MGMDFIEGLVQAQDHELLYHSTLATSKELALPKTLSLAQLSSQDTLADQSYFPCRPNNKAGLVISKIEDIFESIVDCFVDNEAELSIELRSNRRRATTKSSTPSYTTVRFPGRNENEAWKFTVLLRILKLSHEALVSGTITTKRDMYYRDPELFLKQEVVDRYVDDLAYTFGVERDALNVVAAAKGLIAGNVKLTMRNGCMINCSAKSEGLLLPDIKDVTSIDVGRSQWILVIEKEATFRTLTTSNYWHSSAAGRGILLCGKGYPDIATRVFLRHLSQHHLDLQIHGLFDFDPDGLGILSTYKYGSAALSHQPNLAVHSLSHLGVHSSDLIMNVEAESKKQDIEGLMRLTKRDRRKASRMLEHHAFQPDTESEWRRELQVMLMLNVKAEIQILGHENSLAGHLDRKLCRR